MVKKILVISLWLCAIAILAACVTPPNPEGPPRPTLSEQQALGQRVFTQNCAACHATTPDTVVVGPSLHKIAQTGATRVEGQDAETYITLSIIDPSLYVNEGFDDLMPKTFGRSLTGQELDALVAYLLTLE